MSKEGTVLGARRRCRFVGRACVNVSDCWNTLGPRTTPFMPSYLVSCRASIASVARCVQDWVIAWAALATASHCTQPCSARQNDDAALKHKRAFLFVPQQTKNSLRLGSRKREREEREERQTERDLSERERPGRHDRVPQRISRPFSTGSCKYQRAVDAQFRSGFSFGMD